MAKFFMFPNPCLNIVLGLSGRYSDTVMYSVECTLQFHTCDICHVRISHYYYKNPTFPGPVEYLHRAYMWEDITMHLSWLARILGSQYSPLSVGIFPPSNCRLFNWFSHRIWTIHSIAWNSKPLQDMYFCLDTDPIVQSTFTNHAYRVVWFTYKIC